MAKKVNIKKDNIEFKNDAVTQGIEVVEPVKEVSNIPGFEMNDMNVDPDAFSDSEETTDKKNVRIRLTKPYKTSIGGKMWIFKANKVYNVPENVKFVLNRAGLLAVL